MPVRKIINDPVYGFITIDHPLIFSIINHPWYQRLRRIQQMALAGLVYPGAVHTRFHHSLGAYHLMGCALGELRNKGISITPEEELAAKAAILLHDIGHGPFSHALEHVLIEAGHESISRLLMKRLNEEFNGALDLTIAIFNGQYEKHFLHQLISGQLDVDRMDYLTRDSFFTGVSEGVIGYDRILKMLTVHNGALMVEEKGIYSIEKFLVARRQMYWQVYLHKTVLSAEQMLVNIIRRARELVGRGELPGEEAGTPLSFFLAQRAGAPFGEEYLDKFCLLDDQDIMGAIKGWMGHRDIPLSTLSTWLINRNLLKIRLQAEPIPPAVTEAKKKAVAEAMELSEEAVRYLVFDGTASNSMYNVRDERIHILFKNGQVRDISEVDDALIHQTLSSPVKKFYFCYPGALF